MREIKFRAWDKQDNKMYDEFTTEDFFGDNSVRGFSHYTGIFMQSTGLQDKNGVEIYEGDVVKTNTNNIVSVDYSNYYGAYLFGGFPTNQDEIYKLEIEVIGNIYETPELLANK